MEVVSQIETFAVTILTGVLLGVMFDGYRVMRGVHRPHFFVTLLLDILIWLVATIVVFGALILSNWGEVRLYVLLGLLLGIVLYYKLLSWYIIKLMQKCLRLLAKLIHLTILPIKTLYCKGKKILVWLRQNFHIKPPKA